MNSLFKSRHDCMPPPPRGKIRLSEKYSEKDHLNLYFPIFAQKLPVFLLIYFFPIGMVLLL